MANFQSQVTRRDIRNGELELFYAVKYDPDKKMLYFPLPQGNTYFTVERPDLFEKPHPLYGTVVGVLCEFEDDAQIGMTAIRCGVGRNAPLTRIQLN